MKKYLLVILVFSLVFLGCTRNDVLNIDVNTIADLPTLQTIVTQVSEDMSSGKISMDQAQVLVDQLQQKYVDLTNGTDTTIETTFAVIQKVFDKKSLPSYTLPLWSKKLGLTEPKGMELNKALSTYTAMNASGYGSTTLVYKGDYTLALQQAQRIAQKASLYISKDFQQAQALAKVGNIDYISGLDIGSLTKGIVYVNHELLETNVANLMSVSVDPEGTLTLEAIQYKN
ncbi:MAG: hypothetical protein NT085_04205 [candidate division SR1 bacterium]|nr:hypothetical protein [candidate division SR1 bacterium]